MSWDQYICNMMGPDDCGVHVLQHVAICGIQPGQESVWASTPSMANLTPDIIKKLSQDRTSLPLNGVHLAGLKCRLIRDLLDVDQVYTLDMKTAKVNDDDTTYNVCISKSLTAIIIGIGKKDINGGQVSKKVCEVTDYLRKLNM